MAEIADNKHSDALAKILDIVSVGEIVGPVNGLQDVFFDGTPVQNPDGTSNFENYQIDWRVGTSDQAFMPMFPAVENETAVSVALIDAAPWISAIQNTQLTAVRIRFGVPALEMTNQSNGDIGGYTVQYAIDLSTDGGDYATVVTDSFSFKSTTLYERSVRIDLPAASTGWLVRVRRLTPNAHNSYIQDTVNIEAITEVIDRKLRYPGIAYFGLQFDAKAFSSVPARSFRIRGRIVEVPANYDPETRIYDGIWDGTFKRAWTNCPPWIFRDIALDKKGGAGKYVDASSIDKWTLYEIAQWCDQMVPDGKGGQEPRFTCNCIFNTQADAFKVLQDLAGIFWGQAYWGAGQALVTADMPGDVKNVYTNANVIDGEFTYAGTERKTRYTSAQISYNDPANQFKQAVEPVLAASSYLARYGYLNAQVTAFGCTSQGQAHRLGLWTIYTSLLEAGTTSFKVGLDGQLSLPGEIVGIADANKAGRRIGGRVRAMPDLSTVYLDKNPTVGVGDSLTVTMPVGVTETHEVVAVEDDGAIRVDNPYSDICARGAIWALESADLAMQLARVVAIEESDTAGEIAWTMTVAKHEPGKAALIDNGVKLALRPVTVIPASIQAPPTNVRISEFVVTDQGTAKTTAVFECDTADGATSYAFEWRKDGGNWITLPASGATSVQVQGIYTGAYSVRARAANPLGVQSVYAYAPDTILQGKTGAPPVVATLTTTARTLSIGVDWGFPVDGANDTKFTELWYSKTRNLSDAVLLSTMPYPASHFDMLDIESGASLFFWARLVDTSGNVGAFYPPDFGVNGQSDSEASDVLSVLDGKIGATQLAKDLSDTIAAIPAVTDAANMAIDKADAIIAQYNVPAMAGDDTALAGDDSSLVGEWSQQAALAETQLALEQQIEALQARVNFNGESTLASIQTERQERADATSALAQQITTLGAQVNGVTAAAIEQEAQTRADAISALAQEMDTLQTSINGEVTAQVQEVKQTYADLSGAISATYMVKTEVTQGGTPYIAGMALGVEASGDGSAPVSQALFSVSRFAIIDPNSEATLSPFVVQDGQVFMAQALIGKGWITDLMIGDTIQSTAVNAKGLPLWIIDKNNGITLNDPNGTDAHVTLNNGALNAYDANLVLRVECGLWAN